MDKRRVIQANPVLEGILDKGDEDHRRDLDLVRLPDDQKIDVDIVISRETEFLELDDPAHLGDFLVQVDPIHLAVVNHIPHQVRQARNPFGRGRILVPGHAKEIVEGVEEKMRIDLGLQEIELGLKLFGFRFLELQSLPDRFLDEFCRRGHDDGEPDKIHSYKEAALVSKVLFKDEIGRKPGANQDHEE